MRVRNKCLFANEEQLRLFSVLGIWQRLAHFTAVYTLNSMLTRVLGFEGRRRIKRLVLAYDIELPIIPIRSYSTLVSIISRIGMSALIVDYLKRELGDV